MIKLNPAKIAIIERERTPISVLLSTKSRNAPIPLVSQAIKSPRATKNEFWENSAF